MSRLTFQGLALWRALQVGGVPVVWRRVSLPSGPEPRPNPATIVGDLRVVGVGLAGEDVVRVGARRAYGRFVVGDRLSIWGHSIVYAVRDEAVFVNNECVVPVSPSLLDVAAQDALVRPYWSADRQIFVKLDGVPERKVDGSNILAGDLVCVVPSHNLRGEVRVGDLMIYDGRVYSVVGVTNILDSGDVVGYNVYLRRS